MEDYEDIKKKFPKRLNIARLFQESKGNYDQTFLNKTGEYLEQIVEECKKVCAERNINERNLLWADLHFIKMYLLDLVCMLGPDFNDELLEESKRILHIEDIHECFNVMLALLNKYGYTVDIKDGQFIPFNDSEFEKESKL